MTKESDDDELYWDCHHDLSEPFSRALRRFVSENVEQAVNGAFDDLYVCTWSSMPDTGAPIDGDLIVQVSPGGPLEHDGRFWNFSLFKLIAENEDADGREAHAEQLERLAARLRAYQDQEPPP